MYIYIYVRKGHVIFSVYVFVASILENSLSSKRHSLLLLVEEHATIICCYSVLHEPEITIFYSLKINFYSDEAISLIYLWEILRVRKINFILIHI